MEKGTCLVFISFVTGIAISSVGDVLEKPHEPLSWAIALMMFFIMAFPSSLAYIAGRKDAVYKIGD